MEDKEFNLTPENYHSPEARHHYMGVSLFKEFEKCEVMGLAKANGEFEEETTSALLFGSYVDAYFSNELNDFVASHPEMFKKDGTLKADYKSIEEVIEAIEGDEVLMKYLNGEKQVIMTGEIAGVPWKIKIDAYHTHKVIVDQKIMKDMEPVWVERDGFNMKTDFIDAYGYDLQGASYQEIVKQNTGEQLPFVLAVTTKQECPTSELIKIDQEYLDIALDKIKAKAPRYWDIINGKIEPVGCGKCPACRKIHKVTGVQSYSKLFKEKEA